MSQSEYPSWLGSVITIVLVINYIILCPSSLLFIKQAWAIKHELYIRARKIRITMICGLVMLTIIIIHPVLLCLYFWLKSRNMIVNTMIHILVIILGIVPLVCVALRLWLFYYKYKLSEAIFKAKRMELQIMKKEELKSNTPAGQRQSVSPFVATPKQVDVNQSYPDTDASNVTVVSPSSKSVATNSAISSDEIITIESMSINPLQFWIDNQNKLGSGTGCLRIVIIFMISDICIIAVCSFLQVLISYAIQSVIYIALLIFIHYHVNQLSPVRDQFFVRRQFATELKIIYFNFMLWIACLCVWFFTRNNNGSYNIYDNTDNVNIRIIIRFLLDGNMTCTAFLLIIAQFAIPLHQFKEKMDTLSNRNVLTTTATRNKALKVRLEQCITDREGYYLFMEHLMKEHAVENLLFITEVTHMKQKFEDSLIVTQTKSPSGSVSKTLKKWTELKSGDAPSEVKAKPKPKEPKKVRQLSQIPSDAVLVGRNDTEIEDLVNANKSAPMFEMGVINGKKLTISAKMVTTTSFMENQRKVAKRNMAIAELPHTVTLAESMKQNNLFDSVDMIYDNFVVQRANHAINISADVQQKITKLVMQHRSSVEAQREKLQRKSAQGSALCTEISGMIVDVHIFDDAYTEVMRLLRSTFTRFTTTNEYKIYCSAMEDK